MGVTSYKGSASLQIHHGLGRYATFAPGDTIVGHISRSIPIVSPHAVIRITLCGRTKSKIVISRGNNNRSYYRGRFTVVDEDALSQTIFTGPVHIASTPGSVPEAHTWPFAIDIPAYCNLRKLINSVPSEQSYLPLTADNLASLPLPNTFNMDHAGFSTNREGFVEYFLKASIHYTEKSSSKSQEAILPIIIRGVNTDPPIADFSLLRHRHFGAASSFRLLPGMESTELTFSQKRQSMFGSSKVPRISGQMEIDLPRVLQLDNPNPVPIQLRFVPDPKITSSGLRGVPAKIILKTLSMEITSVTHVLCDGTFSPHQEDDEEERTFRIWPPPGTGLNPEPLYIPCTDEWPPVEIGSRTGFSISSKPAGRAQLHPDFTTFNIKHSHRVKYEMVAFVPAAEQEMKMKFHGKLIILPPSQSTPTTSARAGSSTAVVEEEAPPPPFQARSESWIHPPAEGDAPPTFAQVQKEDLTRKSNDGRGEAYKNGESA